MGARIYPSQTCHKAELEIAEDGNLDPIQVAPIIIIIIIASFVYEAVRLTYLVCIVDECKC